MPRPLPLNDTVNRLKTMPGQLPVGQAITRIRRRDWAVALLALGVALAALIVGSAYGDIKSNHVHPQVIGWASAAALLLFGIFGTGRASVTLSRFVAHRYAQTAAGAVRVLTAGVGYVFVLFALLGLLEVSIEHLLVGAGLAGIVLGIAAQQSLGNVFAGMVLLLAHPFNVGDSLRVRSGSLGGVFDAEVVEMSLTYVTLHMDDGDLKVPNSVMLAAGVMTRPVGLAAAPPVGPAPAPAQAAVPAPTPMPTAAPARPAPAGPSTPPTGTQSLPIAPPSSQAEEVASGQPPGAPG